MERLSDQTPAERVMSVINNRQKGDIRPWTHEEMAQVEQAVNESRYGTDFNSDYRRNRQQAIDNMNA